MAKVGFFQGILVVVLATIASVILLVVDAGHEEAMERLANDRTVQMERIYAGRERAIVEGQLGLCAKAVGLFTPRVGETASISAKRALHPDDVRVTAACKVDWRDFAAREDRGHREIPSRTLLIAGVAMPLAVIFSAMIVLWLSRRDEGLAKESKEMKKRLRQLEEYRFGRTTDITGQQGSVGGDQARVGGYSVLRKMRRFLRLGAR